MYFPSGGASSLSMLSSISGPSATDNILSLPVSTLNNSSSGLQILGGGGGGGGGNVPSNVTDKPSNIFRNINAGYLPGNADNHGGPSASPGGIHAGGVAGGAHINPAAHSNITQYSSLLGNNPSSILNNGLNPLAPAVSTMTTPNSLSLTGVMSNGAALNQNNVNVMQHQGQAQHQPAFYVQQAVYLDQNGQPIYYRAGEYYSQLLLVLLLLLLTTITKFINYEVLLTTNYIICLCQL